MSRVRQTDILIELLELGHERIIDLRQLLLYYRASVYKGETAQHISGTLDHLRLLSTLIGDELLLDSWRDDDAVVAAAKGSEPIPGECSLSRRLAGLTAALEAHFDRIGRLLASRSLDVESLPLADTVRLYRNQLLAICRAGSRPWRFFEAL